MQCCQAGDSAHGWHTSFVNLNLKNQSIAIIGAARGIGRAIAEGFRSEGCLVRALDREANTNYITAGDVTDFEAMKAFAASFDQVDHVVFCAGIGSGKFGFPFWNPEPFLARRQLCEPYA